MEEETQFQALGVAGAKALRYMGNKESQCT